MLYIYCELITIVKNLNPKQHEIQMYTCLAGDNLLSRIANEFHYITLT